MKSPQIYTLTNNSDWTGIIKAVTFLEYHPNPHSTSKGSRKAPENI